MLVTLLVLEGLAALLVTLLNLVTSNALGQDFLPWSLIWFRESSEPFVW